MSTPLEEFTGAMDRVSAALSNIFLQQQQAEEGQEQSLAVLQETLRVLKQLDRGKTKDSMDDGGEVYTPSVNPSAWPPLNSAEKGQFRQIIIRDQASMEGSSTMKQTTTGPMVPSLQFPPVPPSFQRRESPIPSIRTTSFIANQATVGNNTTSQQPAHLSWGMEFDASPRNWCSKEHMTIYQEWFDFADSDGDGRLTGGDATKFFSMSNLPFQELKKVWTIADFERQGFLSFREFVFAMKLTLKICKPRQWKVWIIFFLRRSCVCLKVNLVRLLEVLPLRLHQQLLGFYRQIFSIGKLEMLPLRLPPAATWFLSSKSAKKVSLTTVTSIVDGLKKLYIQKLKPLEVRYHFNGFISPLLANGDFDAKPMVMLLGQYSTGKTTFIKHLLKTSYPGANIGPEPTTDKLVVVMNGPDERSIPGNTIAVQADMPFSGLTTFGTAFLSKFECSQMPHHVLEHITLVDTPGVLSGEKQRTQRSYDFTGVVSWFAAKCDLIIPLFDPHKLDTSDEFKRVIVSLRGHDDKIRVVLNKADQVDTQQLMRVYGALMWSLGKVLNTPEVARVYIGSFNDKPINEAATGSLGRELFEREQDDLLTDLKNLPKKACDRRINEFVKRARAAKIHACIIGHLRKEMPVMIGKAQTQQRLIDELENEFRKVQREFHLPAGDFPDVEHFREVLSDCRFDTFEKLKPKMIQDVDDMLAYDIPELLKNFRNPYD